MEYPVRYPKSCAEREVNKTALLREGVQGPIIHGRYRSKGLGFWSMTSYCTQCCSLSVGALGAVALSSGSSDDLRLTELVKAAKRAAHASYSPYSEFRV